LLPDEIIKEALSKGISPSTLALQGLSDEDIIKYIKSAPSPPRSALGEFGAGLARTGLGTIRGLSGALESIGLPTEDIAKWSEEELKKFTPRPASFIGKVAGTLGEFLPFVLVPEDYAVALFGLSGYGSAYGRQPEELKGTPEGYLRALTTGALHGLLAKVPAGAKASKFLKGVRPFAERPYLRSIVGEATALPLISSGFLASSEFGAGRPVEEALKQSMEVLTPSEALPLSVAGAIFGIPRGFFETKAEKPLKKEIEKTISKEKGVEYKSLREIKKEIDTLIEKAKKEKAKKKAVLPEEIPSEKVTPSEEIPSSEEITPLEEMPPLFKKEIDYIKSIVENKGDFKNFIKPVRERLIKPTEEGIKRKKLITRKTVERVLKDNYKKVFEVERILKEYLDNFIEADENFKDYIKKNFDFNGFILKNVNKQTWSSLLDDFGDKVESLYEKYKTSIEEKPLTKRVKLEELPVEEVKSPEVPEKLFIPEKERISEEDLVKLFLSHKPLYDDLRKEISSSIDRFFTSVDDIFQAVKPFGEGQYVEVSITTPTYSYIEGLFGNVIGPRIEDKIGKLFTGKGSKKRLEEFKQKADAFEARLNELTSFEEFNPNKLENYFDENTLRDVGYYYLRELKNNPKEFLYSKVSKYPEVYKRLFEIVAENHLKPDDLLAIISKGSLAREKLREQSSLSYIEGALNNLKDRVKKLKGKKGNPIDILEKELSELSSSLSRVSIEKGKYVSNEISLLRNFISYLKKTKVSSWEDIFETKGKKKKSLFYSFIDGQKNLLGRFSSALKKIEEEPEGSFWKVVSELPSAFVSSLQKMPFLVNKSLLRDTPDNLYKKTIDLENRFIEGFKEKYSIRNIFHSVRDEIVDFIVGSREYKDEASREQARADIAKVLDNKFASLLESEDIYSIIPNIKYLPIDPDRGEGYVFLTVNSYGNKSFVSAMIEGLKAYKEGIVKDIFASAVKEIIPQPPAKKFVFILDAKRFKDFLEGKIADIREAFLLGKNVSLKSIYNKYVKSLTGKSILSVWGKKEKDRAEVRVLNLLDKNIITDKEKLNEILSENPDIAHFFENPSDYVKSSVFNFLLKSDVVEQLDEYEFMPFGEVTPTEETVPVEEQRVVSQKEELVIKFRTEDLVKKDPSILSNPLRYVDFMRETIARVVGKEVGIFLGKEGSEEVKKLADLFGRRFVGFSAKLMNKEVIGLVYGENLNYLKTFGHELFHVIEPSLSSEDTEVLYSKYGDTEAIAEAFADYVFEKIEPPSFAKKVFDFILKIIERLKNYLKGLGFHSSEDIFNKIWAGKLAKEYKTPDEIPLLNFVDVWELARSQREDFSNYQFDIAFRSKINEVYKTASDSIKEILNDFSFAKVKALLQGTHITDLKAEKFRKEFLEKEKIGFLKKYVILPSFNPVLRRVKDMYDEANRETHERFDPKFEQYYTKLGDYAKHEPELFQKITKIILDLNADGRYYPDIEEFIKERFPDINDNEIEAIKEIIDIHKKFTDSVLITRLKETFFASYNAFLRFLEGLSKEETLPRDTYNQLLSIIGEIPVKALDELYREYDYEIVTEEKKGKLNIDIEKGVAEQPTIKIKKRVAINDKRDDFIQFINTIENRLKEFIPEENLQNIILSGFNRYLKEIINYSYEIHKGLDDSFYFPLLRNGGDYELRVLTKYEDPKKGLRYVEIGYYDSEKGRSDFAQQNQIASLLKNTVSELSNYTIVKSDEWHVSQTTLSEFLDKKFPDKKYDYVIVVGRKPPKTTPIVDRLSPSEAINYINNIIMRIDNSEFRDIAEKELTQAIFRLYADVNFALARKIARKRLPSAFSEKLIKGYKENVLEVMQEYFFRMTGHLTNASFTNRIMQYFNSSDTKELFIKNPEMEDITYKYVDMISSPHSKLANFVYKARAITAIYYLGARFLTALLNYVNLLTFLPAEIAHLKTLKTISGVISEFKATEGIKYPEKRIKTKEYVKGLGLYFKDLKKSIRDFSFYAKKGWISLYPFKINLDKAIRDNASFEDIETLKTLQTMTYYGVLESSFLRTIRLEGMHLFGSSLRKVFSTLMYPFSFTEMTARTIAGIMVSKHLIENLNVRSNEARQAIVKSVIEKTFFDYSRANRPFWANPRTPFGAISALPLTLRGFTLNTLSLLYEWLGKRQFEKIATFMMASFILGGVSSLPFMDDLLDIFERLTKKPLRMKIKNEIAKTVGEDFSDLVVKGVPYVMNFADLSASLRTELPVPKDISFDGISDFFLGVYKQAYKRIERGFQDILDGEYISGLSYLLPFGISMPIQSFMLSTKGLRTRYGRPIIEAEVGEPFKFTTGEAILRALGFRPVRLAEIQDTRYFGIRLERWFNEEKKKIYKKIRNAESYEDYKEIVDEIIELNKKIAKYQGLVSPISETSIERALTPAVEKYKMITSLI